MNIDTNITLGFGDIYMGLTPLEFSHDKSWGITFNILKWGFHLKESQLIDNTFALLSYTNTKYLYRLEVLGFTLINKLK